MWLLAVAGLLQPLVKELTNVQDPLTCLSALSLLKEQVEQASSSRLQSLLANFFLPHLEQLLRQADSIVKPMAMQARICIRLTCLECHLRLYIFIRLTHLGCHVCLCSCHTWLQHTQVHFAVVKETVVQAGSSLLQLCIALCSCINWNRPDHSVLSAVVSCGMHLVTLCLSCQSYRLWLYQNVSDNQRN